MVTSQNEPSTDVPMFLRKTFAMINSAEEDIACWSEDGETFVIKDPERFEKTVIPQFFKHSKFSSFVRQLNFYSFRKIKYSDTIRIDLQEEKKTANYWRFRHENFQRGKPELLIEIKRMNGAKSKTTTTTTTTTLPPTSTAVVVASSVSTEQLSTPVSFITNPEVVSLKKRIDEMSKTMENLTAMVQEVTLQQQPAGSIPGTKRKKVQLPVVTTSTENLDTPVDELPPDEILSTQSMDLEDIPDVVESTPSSILPMPASRESSGISDSEFVDQLFTAFNSSDGDDESFFDLSIPTPQLEAETIRGKNNRPDPELMKRLGDALELLPKATQEMIINRLIAAIMSPEGFDMSAAVANVEPKKVAASGKALPTTPAPTPVVPTTIEQDAPVPLAAATLAALLHHYSQQVKEHQEKQHQQQQNCNKQQQSRQAKSIPVIPVHA